MPLSADVYKSNVLFPFFDGLIPEGWLLISAPRYFDPDDDDPEIRRTLETITPLLSPHEKPPTGYDREIRRILETLSPL